VNTNTNDLGASLDLTKSKKERLKELFPEAFTELQNEDGELVESLDYDQLKASLGHITDLFEGRREVYGMNWPGKKNAFKISQTRTYATLKPAKSESVDWDTTDNLFIEGDNLEVLKLLQKAYYREVKMIYIDPPYNTGNEFIYPDNFSESLQTYLEYAGLAGDERKKFSTNSKTEGRFHTKWLNMMYPRLELAKNLLKEDGVILVSIDEHEIENLNRLMDEVFGEANRIATIVWKGATDNNPTRVAVEHEYIVCFAKNIEACPGIWKSKVSDAKEMMLAKYGELRQAHRKSDIIQEHFRKYIKDNVESFTSLTHYNLVDEDGPYTGSRKVHNPKPGGYVYKVKHPRTKKTCLMPANGYRFPEGRMIELIEAKKIIFGDDHTQIIQIKEYLHDYEAKLSSVIHLDSRAGANEIGRLLGERKVFTNPKPFELLSYLFDFQLGDGELLLDFFAGSCASAQAVMDLNARDNTARRFIMVQLPEQLDDSSKEQKEGLAFCRKHGLKETIAEISKERLRKACDKYSGASSSQKELSTSQTDHGFRVLKLDRSNFRKWQLLGKDSSPADIVKQLDLHVEHIDPRADEEALLFEILLKVGHKPTEKVKHLPIGGISIFSIANDALLICLAPTITKEIIGRVVELRPEQFICLDSAFHGNDQLKANAVQTFASCTPANGKIEHTLFRTV